MSASPGVREGAQATLELNTADVLRAVQSLYADEVKPSGRLILHRLLELAAEAHALSIGLPIEDADPEALPRIDPVCLRWICHHCDRLWLSPEPAGEYSCYLVGEPYHFVDAASPYDPYPADLWAGAAAHFESLASSGVRIRGGRYRFARELAARRLPFLAGRSVGQICHIVHLAISSRKLLGFSGGCVVPFCESEGHLREQLAVNRQPATQETSMPQATLEAARAGLRKVLSENLPPEGVNICSVRRLFWSRCQMELSVTALGHTSLIHLLLDECFRDICVLYRRGATMTFVLPAGAQTREDCASESSPGGSGSGSSASAACGRPSCFARAAFETFDVSTNNTLIHVGEEESSPGESGSGSSASGPCGRPSRSAWDHLETFDVITKKTFLHIVEEPAVRVHRRAVSQ